MPNLFCVGYTLFQYDFQKKKVKRATTKRAKPQRRLRSEQEILGSLFTEDEDYSTSVQGEVKERIQKIQRRNSKAVKDLKELYEHKCQITGDQLTFLKRDGIPYTEAHHLEPLAAGGADNPFNMIVVNPLTHKMLHYAKIEGQYITEDNYFNFHSGMLDSTAYEIHVDLQNQPFTATGGGLNINLNMSFPWAACGIKALPNII